MPLDARILERLRQNDITLIKLDLSNNKLDSAGVKNLAEALQHNTTLKCLNLAGCQIGSQFGTTAMKDLAAVLQYATLMTLNLCYNNIGPAGAKNIALALPHNKTLKKFNLSNNHIGNKGAKDLADALQYNRTLTQLDLNLNDITDLKITDVISDALQRNRQIAQQPPQKQEEAAKIVIPLDTEILKRLHQNDLTLTKLHLGGNNIGDVEIKILAEALQHNTTVTMLNLYNNNIGNLGVKYLSDILTTHTTLRQLHLDGNNIGTPGAKDLSLALQKNTVLTELYLTMNDIGLIGVKEISQAFATNTTLRQLNLSNNGIDVSEEDLNNIHAYLKRNRQTAEQQAKICFEQGQQLIAQQHPASAAIIQFQRALYFQPKDKVLQQALKDAQAALEHPVQEEAKHPIQISTVTLQFTPSFSAEKEGNANKNNNQSTKIPLENSVFQPVSQKPEPMLQPATILLVSQTLTTAVKSADDYFQQGLIHHQAGQWEQALTCYDQALQHHPKHLDALAHKGHLMLEGYQDTETATTLLQKALALNASYPLALQGQGLVAFYHKQFGIAQDYFAQVAQHLQRQPSSANSIAVDLALLKARCLMAWDALDDAEIAMMLTSEDRRLDKQRLLLFQQKNQQLQEDTAFKTFLTDVKKVLKGRSIAPPTCFISYAWEEDPEDNKRLQTWLKQLCDHLTQLGAKVYLDITHLDGNMKTYMSEKIQESNYILLIGTPRFKERAEDPTTHLGFEIQHALARTELHPHALVPLLYAGRFATAFPVNVIKELLIRDMRNPRHYYYQMAQLENPLGLIPGLWGIFGGDRDYELRLKTLTTVIRTPTPLPKLSSIIPTPAKLTEAFSQIVLSFSIPHQALSFEQELGKGAYGVVFKGTWQHAEVAIKQFHLTRPTFEMATEFQKEAKLMARLRFPNIVQLYGVSVDKIPYCIVMEYMPQGSLYDVLHSTRPLDWGQRHKIAVDIACGLAYLHKEGILHRDLKSLNVLLDERSGQLRAKLSDFGLAKIKLETRSVHTEKSVGSVHWMAPELFEYPPQYTPQSDIYSYAMTLWEIASRQIPFKDIDPNAIPRLIADKDIRPKIPDDCPLKISQLISFCWNKDAMKRPTAEKAIEHLKTDSGEENSLSSVKLKK
jgi:Ran GTPase-activating protein (RanGAP) involved in mRNA processing and transport/predicted Ser/Thr protein kinase